MDAQQKVHGSLRTKTPSQLLNEIEAIPIDIFEETFGSYFTKVQLILRQRKGGRRASRLRNE